MPREETTYLNQPAPDFTRTSHTGEMITLSRFQGQNNVVLFFVRSFTCWQCREHVSNLGQRYREFADANTAILVVLNGDEALAKRYADVTHAPFPILADPNHEIYDLYGLNKVWFFSTRTGSVVVDIRGLIHYMESTLNPMAWLKESAKLLENVKLLSGIS